MNTAFTIAWALLGQGWIDFSIMTFSPYLMRLWVEENHYSLSLLLGTAPSGFDTVRQNMPRREPIAAIPWDRWKR